MSENILQKIIDQKKTKIEKLKSEIDIKSLIETINEKDVFFDFKKKIQTNNSENKISVIAEIKKASPSAGILIDDYDPVKIANIYNSKNVTCLSVLTEEDFFVDKFQVPLAKSYGADAVLIILAGISEKTADEIYQEALKHNMSVIVEVHTVEEAEKSAKYPDALIGINNRNLKTLKTEINTTYDIYNVVLNHSSPLISESGLKTKDELLDIKNRTSIKSFLIGESLLKDLENNNIFSLL